MRTLLLLLMLSSVARAKPDTLAPLRIDDVSLEKAYKKARNKRNIGIALAVPGVASSLLGIVLIAYGANQEPYINAEIGEIVGGAITLAAGLSVGIPGVVLWSNGQDEMDMVKWRKQQMKVTLFKITF